MNTPAIRPSLLRRLASMIYDTCLVLPIIMAVVATFLAVRLQMTGEAPETAQEAALNAHLVRLIALFTLICFFSWFWMKSGQTLGMQAWRIKVVTTSGGPVGLRHCIIRCLGATLSATCLGLGYLWSLIDRDGCSWHDRLSGTRLLLLPKKK